MAVQKAAETQALTILSQESDDQYLCAADSPDGSVFIATYSFWVSDGTLYHTRDTGQVYARDEINRIPHVANLLAALRRFVWDKSGYTRIEHGSDPQVWYCKHCKERWPASEPEKHIVGCRIRQAHAAINKAKGEVT